MLSMSRLGLALLCLPLTLAAQPPARPSGAQPIENLIVTGSRLVRTPLDNAYPITVLNRESLEASGLASIGAILQELPFAGGSPLGTSVNRRGSGGELSRGIETLELRGLGAQRTLVLVNGRRFVAGGNGSQGVVDLGSLPLAMIERIEVLKTGASVEYGADAVAGVVNLITRDSLDGIELALSGQRMDRGDGDTVDVNAVAGRTLGAGGWVAGLRYFDQASVGKGERAFSRQLLTVEGEDNRIVPDGSSAPPAGQFRTTDGRLTLREGENGDDPADFRPFIDSGPDTDRFNFNPFEDLLQDSRRLAAFLSLEQPLRASLSLFAEASYQQRDAATGLAPLPFFTNRLAGVSVAADNLYNPFAEEITDARRRLVEAGPRRFVQDNRTWRVVLGLSGDLADWRWDAALNHGRNAVTQRQTGELLRDRVARALGPSFHDAANVPRCGPPDAAISGCVPLNLFGGPGSISPAMLDYAAAGALVDHLDNRQTVVNLNVAGEPLLLPHGPLGLAVGYAWREERAVDLPAAATRAGNTTGAARAVTRGRYASHEIYAEIGLPLLRDALSARSLDLDLGARHVQHSRFDTASVFEVGLRYQPGETLVLRATGSQAFRAPTVAELFGGLRQSNPAVEDPCTDFGSLGDVARQRCIDQGVPADGSFNQNGNETPQLGGGNPKLDPEDAAILTVGASWEPAALPGLELSLDLYRIRVDQAIAALGANTILEQCLATGASRFCSAIDRAPDGTILAVSSPLQNIARETARGLDLAAYYRHGAGPGRLRHSLLAGYVIERDRIAFPGAAPFAGAGGFDPDGFGAIPRVKAHYRAHWQASALRLDYAAHWLGALRERGGELAPGTARAVPGQLYHDLGVGWQARSGWQLGLRIENLTDRDPPFLANADVANTDVATYRLLGRTLQLNLSRHW